MVKAIVVFILLLMGKIYSNEKLDLTVSKDNIFGVSWDSKLLDIEKILGNHTGFIRSTNGNKIVTWGDCFAIEFDENDTHVLKIHVSNIFLSNSLSGKIANVIKPEEVLFGIGIKYGMSFTNVEKLFESNDKTDKNQGDLFQYTKRLDGLVYNLSILSMRKKNKDNEPFVVYGISVYKENIIVGMKKTIDLKFKSIENLNIDSKVFFELPWSSTLKNIEAKLGKPIGEFNMINNNILYFWGKNFCLEYEPKSSKVVSLNFGNDSLFSFAENIMEEIPTIDISKIKVTNNLFINQDWNEVLKILKEEPVVYAFIGVPPKKVEIDGLNLILIHGASQKGGKVSDVLRGVYISKE